MKNADTYFINEIYFQNLKTINGINFTPREIDIIACLLNARGASRIASFLSIAPRTVVTHIRNIMLKLGCSSRENIIDFIEKYHHICSLREHYSNLVSHASFEKSLKGIAKLNHHEKSIVVIENQDLKNSIIDQLAKHLRLAGVQILFKNKKENDVFISSNDKVNNPYVAETLITQLQMEEFTKDLNLFKWDKKEFQVTKRVIFLLLENNLSQDNLTTLQNTGHVVFLTEKNYYSSFFNILKICLPHITLDKYIEEFKNQYKITLDIAQPIHLQKLPGADELLQQDKTAPCYIQSDGRHGSVNFSAYSELTVPSHSILLPRPHLLTQIGEKLTKQDNITTLALVGIGGAGKTILARQYARQQQRSIIWEINAETEKSALCSFDALAHALQKTPEDSQFIKGLRRIKSISEREEVLLSFIKEKLKASSDWLLIYDNVEKFTYIQKYFPNNFNTWGKGQVIVTTRDSTLQNNIHINHSLSVGELSFEESLQLFTTIMSNDTLELCSTIPNEKTQTFLQEIPPFPLDVSISAYYLKVTRSSYATYLDHLHQYNKNFDILQKNVLQEAGNYTRTRYGVVILSLENLIEKDSDFMELLLFISFLDSQNIPKELLEQYKDSLIVDDFIYNLKRYSLIINEDYSSTLPMLSFHRSTQHISLDYLIKKLEIKRDTQLVKAMGETLVKYIEDIINNVIKGDCFAKMRILVCHVEAFLSHQSLLTEKIRSSLGVSLGYIYFFLSYYTKAKDILEESLPTLRNNCSGNFVKIAHALTYLGEIYGKLGEYQKSQSFLEESLCIYEKHFPKEHVYRCWSLALLGNINIYLKNNEKAKKLLEESLCIYETLYPRDHVYIAWILIHLGHISREFGDYEIANELFEKPHPL